IRRARQNAAEVAVDRATATLRLLEEEAKEEGSLDAIKVEQPVTQLPPHKSRRAEFPLPKLFNVVRFAYCVTILRKDDRCVVLLTESP
ncbi:MAG: hypothetical protein MN733_30660, partial [Nitrososphaera sp.]|nr:hypothetical protein [Nitrososphaera sp.]